MEDETGESLATVVANSDELDIGNEVFGERVGKFCYLGDNVACRWSLWFGIDDKDQKLVENVFWLLACTNQERITHSHSSARVL